MILSLARRALCAAVLTAASSHAAHAALTQTWFADGGQAGANFGAASSTAGDVNGDGHSDVVIGAWQYDGAFPDEGRAVLYLGSPAGLATTPSWSVLGGQASAHFGKSVSFAGDVNGDGFGDVIVGAPDYDNGEMDEGRALLFLGSASGLDTLPAWIGEPNQVGAAFGAAVGGAGDVNNDGFDDVVIGAPLFDNAQTDEGRASVFLGSASGLALAPVWTTESNQDLASVGVSVAGAGDVNGDGFADVIVGAPLADNAQTNQGRATVFFGHVNGPSDAPDWIAEVGQSNVQFGAAVAGVGDVNGDGYSDVIVGAPLFDNGNTDEGRAFLYLGTSSGPSNTSTWSSEGNLNGVQWGSAVASAGDVNGDGYADIVIGGYLASGVVAAGGRASVFLGSGTGVATLAALTEVGQQAGAGLGRSVASAGDVNGDGFGDVILCAGGLDNGETDEGGAFVYTGAADLPEPAASWSREGEQTGAEYGFRTVGVGDINGDSYGDVIVTARLYTNGQPGEGRALLYLGSRNGLGTTPAWSTEADQDSAEWGAAAMPAGDVNGDGYADFVIGVRRWDGAFVDEGRVVAYYGSPSGISSTPSWSVTGGQATAYLGPGAAGAGDVNGDGYADVITGAYLYDANGHPDAGRADVYLGSASGLSTTPAWTRFGQQDGANYGFKATSAGDVNGDGYSDVIVGAWQADGALVDQGQAFVYLGSAAGLDTVPAWIGSGDLADAQFGVWVNAAGDVNGDGYSDVIVGANKFSGPGLNAGRAYVYLGSPSGVQASPVWTHTGTPGDFVGTVASAGDVNNDGYSDILVGAPMFGNGETEEGIVRLFLGSPSGPHTIADWSFESNRPLARVGEGASSAGDVNGDGFADVIVGSNDYTDPLIGEGAAFLFLGNDGDGADRSIRQMRVNTSKPVVALGLSDVATSFRLLGTARSPYGRTDVALHYDVAPLGTDVDGTLATTGMFVDTGTPNGGSGSSIALAEISAGWSSNMVVHWRARYVTRSPIFPRTPWMWPVSNAVTESDIRMPVTSDAHVPPVAARESRFDVRPTVSRGEVHIAVQGASSALRVRVYDTRGALVRTLDAPSSLTWDGRDARGRAVPAGVYALRLTTGAVHDTRVVVIER